MENRNAVIEMCEKIVDKSPSEEQLWRRLVAEREERKEWNNRLIDAAKRNQVDNVQRLLDKMAGADVAAPTDDGWTPLSCAAANGHLEVVKWLLQAKAEVDAK